MSTLYLQKLQKILCKQYAIFRLIYIYLVSHGHLLYTHLSVFFSAMFFYIISYSTDTSR